MAQLYLRIYFLQVILWILSILGIVQIWANIGIFCFVTDMCVYVWEWDNMEIFNCT